jgi:hypothetical protein
MKYRLNLLTSLVIVVLIFTFIAKGSASAFAFNPNLVIDDGTFNSTGTMSAAQIDGFLNSFGGSCISQSSGFMAIDPTGYNPQQGYLYGGNVTAGQVIYDAAHAYDLNPQVLIATLEKEEGLVRGDGPYGCSTLAISAAVGYGCPDGQTSNNYSGVNLYTRSGTTYTSINGICVNSAQKVGFTQQVIHAAWLFKFSQQRSLGNINWSIVRGNWNNSDDPQSCYSGKMTAGYRQVCPSGPTTYFDGMYGIDGTTVQMQSGGTAALYNYTPHLHGQQLFSDIYNQWFGSATSGVFVAQANGVGGLWAVYGGMKQLIASPTVETAWGLSNEPPITMDANALNAMPARPVLTLLAVNPFSSASNPAYMLADQGGTFDALPSVVQDWGLSPSSASAIGPELVSFTQRLGNLSTFISSPGKPGIYLVDGGTLHVFPSPSVLSMWSGPSPTVASVSNALFSSLTNAPAVSSNQAANGSNSYFLDNGIVYGLPGVLGQIYPHNSQLTVSVSLLGALPSGGNASRFVASPGIPGIYLVDNGQRLALSSPSIFNSYRAPGEAAAITNLTQSGFNTLSAGQSITTRFVYNLSTSSQYYFLNNSLRSLSDQFVANNYGVGLSPTTLTWLGQVGSSACINDFISGNGGNTGIFLLDNGTRHPISNFPEYQLLNAHPEQECELPQEDFAKIPAAGVITPLTSSGGTNYLLDSGNKYAITPTIQQAWGLSSFSSIGGGALAKFNDGGQLSDKFMLGNSYTFVTDGHYYGTTNAGIAGLWGITSNQSHSMYVISYISNSGQLSQFAHSNSSGHPGISLVDQGKFIGIPNPDALFNAGYTGQNIVGVNDNYYTTNTSSNVWQGYLATDAGNNTIYVLEGGNKHLLPASMQADWLGSPQAVTPTSLSSTLLGLLNTGANVSKSFASPNVQGIYAVSNGKKFVIPNYSTYSQSYAPYLQVSSHLVNAVPSQ